MAQIRESCFRITKIDLDDMTIVDLHREVPVIVECEDVRYSTELEVRISNLTRGNIVSGQIQSEDVFKPDGIWRFIELELSEDTEIKFKIGPELDFLEKSIIESPNLSRFGFQPAEFPNGVVVAILDPKGEVWRTITAPWHHHLDAYTFLKGYRPPYRFTYKNIVGTPYIFNYYVERDKEHLF